MPRAQNKSVKKKVTKPNIQRPKHHLKSNSFSNPLPACVSIAGPDDAPFRAALDQFHDGIAIFSAIRDAGGNIVDFDLDYINDAGCRAHQMDRAELVGNKLLTIYPHHKENGLFDAYCKVVETGQPLCRELPVSEEIFGERAAFAIVNINAIKLGDGFAVTWGDVTEQVRTRTALEAQASSLREQAELLDLAHDAIFVRDFSSVILFWNRGAEALYGWEKAEALGTTSHELLQTQFPQPLEEILNQVMREGRWEGELRHTCREGSTIMVHSRWALRRDAHGNPVSILEINSDITLRKRAEEQLRANEVLLRQVLETLPVGVWILDQQGNLVHGNTAAKEIWQGAKYVGIEQYGEYKAWWLSSGKRIEPEEWAAARAIRKGETSLNEEIEIESFDGSRKIMLNSAVPIRNEQEITGAIVVNQDITRRKQGERQVRANAARAEALVRIAARLNARLDLDEVLANVCEQAAHALNAPAAWVNLYNAERQVLDPSAFFGVSSEFIQDYVATSRATFDECAPRDNTPFVILDVQSLHDIPNLEAYTQADIRTVATASMQQKDELIGVLCVPSFHSPRDYTADDLALLQGFADIAAQAIVNARLHGEVSRYGAEMERRVQERTSQLEATNEELQLEIVEREQAEEQILRQNRELAVLYAVAQASTQSTDVEQVLNAALDTTLGALSFECGAIGLVEQQGVSFRANACRGFSASLLVQIELAEKSEGTSNAADREQKPIVRDVGQAATPLAAAAHREGIRALVSVPLLAGGDVIGFLHLGSRQPRVFAPEELRLFGAVGQQLGVAVQNAQLYGAVQSELDERLRNGKQREELLTQLEIANQELEAFSYSVSHDLRTPLHAVEGFARLLLQEHGAELSPTAARYAELVSANTRAMIELVNALLNLSRTARQPLRKQRIEMTELIRQVVNEQAPEAVGRQLEVELGELPSCNADPILLRQVFANLLSNAIKFTRTREVARIEIGAMPFPGGQLGTPQQEPASTDKEQGPGGIAYFVRDNGVGFDMDQADKLFGVFQRLHSEEAYEGTGVGLATVARIVHRHGGRVWAESEPDRGATFYFSLE